MNNNYLSVSDLNRSIKSYLDYNPNLQDVYLKGEISNFKAHTSGHLYFSLKDDNSRIKGIMFARSASTLKFRPVDGMHVLLHGKISVYEASGEYQIYVDEMLEDGIGNLFIALEQLKEKLAKEGLFAKEKKKAIPLMPKKIGVVTAPTGAAIKDIISTIKRRYPIAEIILFPALVQGSASAPDIVKKIKIADQFGVDVLIIGRGGGSIEDLWAFNEEIVARAIYAAKTPIISAVGHEIDFTIADFVADLRAPTPTAAAELAVPNIIDIIGNLSEHQQRLNNAIKQVIKNKKQYLLQQMAASVIKYPMRIYDIKAQRLDIDINNLSNNMLSVITKKYNHLIILKESFIFKNPKYLYEKKLNKFNSLIDKCELLNPLNALKRGYAIVKKDDKTVASINNIKASDQITINLKDGILYANVCKMEEN